MTASLLPLVKARFFTKAGANGTVVALSGGKVHTFAAGTTTPKTSYTDAGMGTPNANPVILDANGEADIWLSGNYKIKLEDSTGTQQWVVDNVKDIYTIVNEAIVGLPTTGDVTTIVNNAIGAAISPAMQPVCSALTLDLAANAFGVPRVPMYRALNGFAPDKVSTNVLAIMPGWLASADGLKFAQSGSNINITLTNVGKNGLDTGIITNGVAYYIYIIKNENTGEVAALASSGTTFGSVVVPAGFTLYRKLPFGFVYDALNWDGIPNFHLSHWPLPLVTFTDAEETSVYRILNAGTSAAFTTVNAAGLIPSNSAMAYLMCKTTAAGINGTSIIEVLGGPATGLTIGAAVAGGVAHYGTVLQRVTSTGTFSYKVTGGAALSLFVLGYNMTEIS